MVKLKIDGVEVEIEEGKTILDAAKKCQVQIPTLCHHPDLDPTASCGICVVKVGGRMMRSCCTPVAEGMDVITRDPEIIDARQTVLKLILSRHPNECLTCLRNENCELQKIASDFCLPMNDIKNITPSDKELPKDCSTGSICFDPRKCILCGRCVNVCQNVQNVWALSMLNRGIDSRVSPAAGLPLNQSPCIKCGQCVAHCPTGALSEVNETDKVWGYIKDENLHTVVQIAPAVRVAIGEAFGLEPGELTTGQLYTALRRLGFDAVFDTNFGADVTIMEEGSEFIDRFTNHPEKLPLITSCCPAWVDYLEHYHHDMIPHFSTCKSPHAIVGALTKTYYADKKGIDSCQIRVVSIMPCTAKKFEIQRSKEMFSSGFQDVDVSLTTRELARMIKQAGIDFKNLPSSEADSPLGEYTGAATVFGFTGGVMEAALRTVYALVEGREMPQDALEVKPILGIDDGIKTMTLNLKGKEVRIAVAHGVGNVDTLLKQVKEAKEKGEEPLYHFIEVMACRGGCVGGGGQPRGVTDKVRIERSMGLTKDDKGHALRCSHQNPSIKKLYDEFLGQPLSSKSHHLLHTSYQARAPYVLKDGE